MNEIPTKAGRMTRRFQTILVLSLFGLPSAVGGQEVGRGLRPGLGPASLPGPTATTVNLTSMPLEYHTPSLPPLVASRPPVVEPAVQAAGTGSPPPPPPALLYLPIPSPFGIEALDEALRQRVDEIADWSSKRTGTKYVIVQLPPLRPPTERESVEAMRRQMNAQVATAIVRLEMKCIELVRARVVADVRRLQPFPQDSDEVKEQKRAIVRETTAAVEALSAKARETARAGTSFREVSRDDHESKFQYEEGTAMRQVRTINVGGWKGL